MFRRHPVLAPLTLIYLGVVGWITLGPQPLDPQQQDWVLRISRALQARTGWSWPSYQHIEFLANVGMFLPVGLFFLLLFGRRLWWLAIVVPFLLTVGIETAQRFIPGRVSDIRDVESNTVGAIAGVVLGLLLTIGSARRARLRRARIRSRTAGRAAVRAAR